MLENYLYFFGWSILHIVNSGKLNSLTCLKLKNKENVYNKVNVTRPIDGTKKIVK
jgi:hypothetical protein